MSALSSASPRLGGGFGTGQSGVAGFVQRVAQPPSAVRLPASIVLPSCPLWLIFRFAPFAPVAVNAFSRATCPGAAVVTAIPLLVAVRSLMLRVIGCTGKVERHVRLAAHDPGIVARGNVEHLT